jgi:hypothetical protein
MSIQEDGKLTAGHNTAKACGSYGIRAFRHIIHINSFQRDLNLAGNLLLPRLPSWRYFCWPLVRDVFYSMLIT